MGCWVRHGLTTLILAGSLAVAAAQTATQPGTPSVPGLELSPAQRQTIYQSISSQTHRSTAAPPTFSPTIGSHVPDGVELTPMPKTVVELIPRTRDYEFAMVADHVLIVDPKSKQVIEVISR
jgi:hypothetical protein